MKVFGVRQVTSTRVVNLYHSTMYHGIIESGESYFISESPEAKLRLARNFYKDGIFKPSGSLIVPSNVVDLLCDTPHLKFVEVDFSNMAYIPYSLSKHRAASEKDAISQLKTLEKKCVLESNKTKYYELICPRFNIDVAKFIQTNQLPSTMTKFIFESSLEEFEVSCDFSVLDEFPVFWYKAYFFHENIYKRISHYFDINFFKILCYDSDTQQVTRFAGDFSLPLWSYIDPETLTIPAAPKEPIELNDQYRLRE